MYSGYFGRLELKKINLTIIICECYQIIIFYGVLGIYIFWSICNFMDDLFGSGGWGEMIK